MIVHSLQLPNAITPCPSHSHPTVLPPTHHSRTHPSRGQTCSFAQDQWGMCDSSQTANALTIARTLGGGEALKLSPCDLLPYLRGRTLWILG